MAEDNGASLVGASLALGLAGPMGALAGAVYGAAAAALKVQYDDLKAYQKLVDGLLTTLQDSPAHHGKLADGTLPKGALGKDFTQAEKLYNAYTTVHTELQKLSKGLAVQIEALGIAIQSAGGGYSEVDEETKRRMALLAKQAHDLYIPKLDPYADKMADGGQSAAPNTSQPKGTKKGGALDE
ncbi:hypothetical protein [Streptomyces sp. ISL-94]|uniref:hypothetical protein n=1 Tax=Streptomyces sp. ISL-94 TaxID=2819190 RepID=UPI001BEB65F2|nr:hypothetical protein [Streptomyces sp. ISL-94]MBT2480990.1 hypothetical protein [Streptomyces sp. ISL-94]